MRKQATLPGPGVKPLDLEPQNKQKIIALLENGVKIPNPMTLYLDDGVRVDQISGDGVTLYPGCRIYGSKTVVSRGAQLGFEGPVTLEDCQVGPRVELKGGYFRKSVFLEKTNMGLGAHVREGTILEEQSGGAHCVGLKQTILFPFATLGSLINFCDCLLAGGTSRKDHSEVGSSYIHFNFSASGDKITPSLFGDVPRGVMLNQSPIFLGGQGGAVGPVRVGFGNVVAAGTILRKDVQNERRLIMGKAHRGGELPFVFNRYADLPRMLEKNFYYLASLVALEQWYRNARRDFFHGEDLGYLIYNGALDNLRLARGERVKRLKALAEKMPDSARHDESGTIKNRKLEFHRNVDEICALFEEGADLQPGDQYRDTFLEGLETVKRDRNSDYVTAIQSLPEAVSKEGTRWLGGIILDRCTKAAELLPAMTLFVTPD
ncbi:MAG: UDP-N-acetylglucosamine pyrophosphorylase [Deltaproteobacteria bacterium]|nr:UDP-N-acetylglucosamine pyrophosphorylase [Deltaproteobacteria bacterium]